MLLIIEGRHLQQLHQEAGGHRFQRVPPTERRGRVHTSTVTVAVIDPDARISGAWDDRSESAFRVEWFSGSGAGGQHRNKHQNSCRLIHGPTGLIEARQGREREANLRDARSGLESRLNALARGANAEAMAQDRKDQIGSGQRGDKVRSIREQDDTARDERNGKRMRAKDYLRGRMDEIW